VATATRRRLGLRADRQSFGFGELALSSVKAKELPRPEMRGSGYVKDVKAPMASTPGVGVGNPASEAKNSDEIARDNLEYAGFDIGLEAGKGGLGDLHGKAFSPVLGIQPRGETRGVFKLIK